MFGLALNSQKLVSVIIITKNHAYLLLTQGNEHALMRLKLDLDFRL